MMTPKERRELHQTSKTLFFNSEKEALEVEEKYKLLFPYRRVSFVQAGENKGRWMLYMKNREE